MSNPFGDQSKTEYASGQPAGLRWDRGSGIDGKRVANATEDQDDPAAAKKKKKRKGKKGMSMQWNDRMAAAFKGMKNNGR
jgi:hypothetical protein